MAKVAKSTSDNTTDVLTGFGHTGRAFGSAASNAGGALTPDSGILEASKAGQAIVDIGASGSGTAVEIAKNGRNDILIKSTKVVGRIGIGASLWGGVNDAVSIGKSIYGDEKNPGGLGNVKFGDALSLGGNLLGMVAAAGVVIFAGATAPAWVTVAGLGSLGLGAASLYTSYQNGDLTLSDVKDIVVGTANQAYQNVSESFREFMGKVGDKFLETVLESDKAFKDFVEKVTDIAKNTQSFTDAF